MWKYFLNCKAIQSNARDYYCLPTLQDLFAGKTPEMKHLDFFGPRKIVFDSVLTDLLPRAILCLEAAQASEAQRHSQAIYLHGRHDFKCSSFFNPIHLHNKLMREVQLYPFYR